MPWACFISLLFINLFFHVPVFLKIIPSVCTFLELTAVSLDSRDNERSPRTPSLQSWGYQPQPGAQWVSSKLIRSWATVCQPECFLRSQGSVAVSANCWKPLSYTSDAERPRELPCPSNPGPRQWVFTSWCLGFSGSFNETSESLFIRGEKGGGVWSAARASASNTLLDSAGCYRRP